MSPLTIRTEIPLDHDAISSVHLQAFEHDPHRAPGTKVIEHRIVERLRDDDALTLSLVAVVHGSIVGHVALSPTTVSMTPGNWYQLGPIGVLPSYQRQGIGTALMKGAIDLMKQQGADGILLVGDPVYYGRFGFKSVDGLTFPGVPSEYVLALAFADTQPSGEIRPHAAFEE